MNSETARNNLLMVSSLLTDKEVLEPYKHDKVVMIKNPTFGTRVTTVVVVLSQEKPFLLTQPILMISNESLFTLSSMKVLPNGQKRMPW